MKLPENLLDVCVWRALPPPSWLYWTKCHNVLSEIRDGGICKGCGKIVKQEQSK